LRLVELELAEVHDPTHRRVGHGGHLDEVEVEVASDRERFSERLDAELLSVWVDEANLTGAYAIVDPVLVGGFSDYAASLLSVGHAVVRGPWWWRAECVRHCRMSGRFNLAHLLL
jgi:hypothetical protein